MTLGSPITLSILTTVGNHDMINTTVVVAAALSCAYELDRQAAPSSHPIAVIVGPFLGFKMHYSGVIVVILDGIFRIESYDGQCRELSKFAAYYNQTLSRATCRNSVQHVRLQPLW